MADSYQKPDDVPIAQVQSEFSNLQFEKDHPTLFSALSQIQSALARVDGTLNNFEKRFDSLEKGLNDLNLKVDRIEERSLSQDQTNQHSPSVPRAKGGRFLNTIV
jgi:septal ring factor EnvC (AmiA/AmiB activator)